MPSYPPTGKIFVASALTSSVAMFDSGRRDDVVPDAVMGLVLAASDVAIDSAGRTYVANGQINTISIFAPDAAPEDPPIATIRGGNTGLESPEGIALDAHGTIYVANSGAYDRYRGKITVYRAGSEGNVAPIATIDGPTTDLHLCTDIAVDSAGRIYVTNAAVGDDVASVTVYAPGSDGDVAPVATIGGSNTGLHGPTGIAVDSGGRIYVANGGDESRAPCSPSRCWAGSVTVYRKGSQGNVAPMATIRGEVTGIGSAQGVAVDPAGTVLVTNNAFMEPMPPRALGQPHAVLVYRAERPGYVAPSATISGDATGLDGPGAIALDSKGRIHVANVRGGANGDPATITVYPADADGDVTPITRLSGTVESGIDHPRGIALDAKGTIYVLNSESVTAYPSGTDRNQRPIATIRGLHTGLVGPSAIAVDANENVYVANQRSTPNTTGSITIYRAGDDGDVAPSRVIAGTAVGGYPRGIAVDSSGNLYVARGPGAEDGVAIYAAGSTGDATPVATIAGDRTALVAPTGIAVDARGRIYCANFGRVPSEDGSVTVYPALARLAGEPRYPDVKPIATIAGPRTGLEHPQSIALDSIGRIYVLDQVYERTDGLKTFYTVFGSIAVFASLGDRKGILDEAPIARIAGPSTTLDMDPTGIAVFGPFVR